LFFAGEQGVWYDPSDLSTLFQDAAGTTPVTAVEQPVGRMLDKSGRGNHATQSTAASRPVLSARVNSYVSTETLATQNVTTLAAQYRLKFEGAGTITLSGTATGAYSAGTHTITCTAGTLTSTVSGAVTKADLRVANDGVNLPPYQRVNTATDYDTAGFPLYLRCDGVNDGMVTNSIDFTATDKMTVFAGVRKLSDALGGVVAEIGPNTNTTSGVGLFAPSNIGLQDYAITSRGTATAIAIASGFAAPTTNVLTAIGDISGDSAILRVNGTQAASSTVDQGTGNYGNYPLYIGRRGGTVAAFNGHIYGLIVRGAATTDAKITQTEKWLAKKTGVTL
jgi:hypothetical protein